MLDNRELATLIWVAISAAFVLIYPKTRKSARKLVEIALGPRLLVLWISFLSWCALWVTGAWLIGLWDLSLLKETVITVATVGFPILFAAMGAQSGREIWRRVGAATVSISIFIAFYLNLAPLPLWAELLGIPLLFFVGALIAVASMRPDGAQVVGCLRFLLVIIGFALLIWVSVQVVATFGEQDWGTTFSELLLSIWVPLVIFPFCYVAAFWSRFGMIDWSIKKRGKNPPLRVRLAAFLGLRFSLAWASHFNGRYDYPVANAGTFRLALTRMRQFRETVSERAALERERVAKLERLAGETGDDRDGAQLDRREFHETKQALDHLFYTQLGRPQGFWHTGDEYQIVFDVGVKTPGLPKEHGVQVETTRDRRVWRGWRRLPSGWVLGIGSFSDAGKFHYSGAEPPTTWPGPSAEWIEDSSEARHPDWLKDDHPIDY